MSNKSEISFYLNQIAKTPVLSHEEQAELAVKAKKGDMAARNKLVESNLKFVVNTAKAYQNHGLDLIDLISEGNIGLITAIEKFDGKKGNHFITYAVWWIRQSILKAINETGRSIRLPQHRSQEVLQIEKAKKHFELGTEDKDLQKLGEMLGLSHSLVKELVLLTKEMASLDAIADGADSDLGSLLADEKSQSPEEYALESSLKSDLESVLKTLKPMEEKVLRLRYGIGDGKERSLSEVGKVCGLTKERIRQIESAAITRIHSSRRSRALESYLAA